VLETSYEGAVRMMEDPWLFGVAPAPGADPDPLRHLDQQLRLGGGPWAAKHLCELEVGAAYRTAAGTDGLGQNPSAGSSVMLGMCYFE